MVTLAFAQMAYYVIHDTPLGGGTDGIYLYHKPIIFRDLVLDGSTFIYLFNDITLAYISTTANQLTNYWFGCITGT
jgi:branched-chain amino acid transport system permease protein